MLGLSVIAGYLQHDTFWYLWTGVALIGSILGTWWAIRYAHQRALLDQPGERRSHQVATPRGGGIAIVVMVLLFGMLCLYVWPSASTHLILILAGLLLVAGIGWMDDHRPLSVRWRLWVHLIAASLFASIFLMAGQWHLTLIALIAVLVLVNIWNFMDGIDGLAASQAVIVVVGLGWLCGLGFFAVANPIVAAILGFLVFNFPKARIFLGDVGSGALGYLMAVLLVLAMTQTAVMAWPLLLLPLTAFLVDASFTLLVRMIRREAWWTAHVQHVYQRWAKALGSHVPVTWVYAGYSILSVSIAWLARDWTAAQIFGTCALWVILTIVAWLLLRKEVPLTGESSL